MENFEDLLKIADILLGPNGCQWDREQTLFSLQPYFIEESHEVVEAIDKDDNHLMTEEAGDLLFAIVFLAKIGEREGRFTIKDIVKQIIEKLIRRHPHVFAGLKVQGSEEIEANWDELKKREKGKEIKTPFERIPPTLPLLSKAQKVIHRILKEKKEQIGKYASEDELKKELLYILKRADKSEMNVESALRRLLLDLEKEHSKDKLSK